MFPDGQIMFPDSHQYFPHEPETHIAAVAVIGHGLPMAWTASILEM